MPFYIYEKSNDRFQRGRCDVPDENGDVPQITDTTVHGVQELDNDPDIILERRDAGPTGKRAATQEEIADDVAAEQHTAALSLIDAPVMAAVLGGVVALVAEHGPGSGEEWSASDLRQHVIDTLTPLL